MALSILNNKMKKKKKYHTVSKFNRKINKTVGIVILADWNMCCSFIFAIETLPMIKENLLDILVFDLQMCTFLMKVKHYILNGASTFGVLSVTSSWIKYITLLKKGGLTFSYFHQ